MKKLNITKKQYAESKYFTNKYGSLKYMSESGKLYKTDKGVVLALEGTEPAAPEAEENPVQEETDDKAEGKGEEITRGELTEMLKDVVGEIEKVCDSQDVSFNDVVGIEPEGEADEAADADEVVATTDEVAEVLQGVIQKVEDIAEKNDIELPEEEDGEEPEQADEGRILDAIKQTGGEMVDKVKKGIKKGMTKIGDQFHGIYRKNDKVSIKGKAGDVDGVVVSASPDEVVIKPDNERSFDEDACECGKGEKCECGGSACECGGKKLPARESVRRRVKARLFREALARRRQARKVRESIERKRKARKVLESIRRKRAVKRVLESRKAR